MFNLLVKYNGWAERADRIPAERLFEHTDAAVAERFRADDQTDFDALTRLPTVFMPENYGGTDHAVRVGKLYRVRKQAKELSLEYTFDATIPAFTNEVLEVLSDELGIDKFEFSRTHWAVKDADLFESLLRQVQPRRNRPRVFTLYDPERIEPQLVSAMMPFSAEFRKVYDTIKETSESVGLRCRRADDIWENPAVIQDVVSLIDRSRVVICDCSGKNPNVFYEAGIAHTLGREVILITQSEQDIPFDLRHLRYVRYLNNEKGRNTLREQLAPKLASIVGS